jgi:dipeptidyl aminopeptidase/acylaminoacyl peptidase
VLTRTSWLYDGAWSPDGRRIAVAEIGQKVSRIVVYPATGGRGQVWLRRTARQQLNDMNGAIVQIAGWWRNLGIGFWVFGNGMVHNNDAAPLDLVGAPGAEPITLGRTLSDGQTDELAANARGNVAIVAGGWRDAWAGKHVELCTSAGAACAVLPHPSKSVTVDPAWSPDGTTLAYGVAPSVRSGPWSQGNLSRWFTAHRVFLYDGATKKVRQLTVAHGATAITWSRDGKSLLYVRDDALWLLSSLGGTPTRVAAPLFSPGRWPQYYAQVPWAQQFAWSS